MLTAPYSRTAFVTHLGKRRLWGKVSIGLREARTDGIQGTGPPTNLVALS
jgi:hypothetical protein